MVSSSVYDGETYDARLEQPGWAGAGFDAAAWTPVPVVAATCFNPVLTPLPFPDIGVEATRAPVSVTRLSPDLQVVDFGQNLAGWCRLTVPSSASAAGTNVTLVHAEVLQHPPYGPADGNVYVGNLRSAKATDVFVLKGDAQGEAFEPHFTYHGFRYVAVWFYPGDLDTRAIQQVHFRTLNPVASSFFSSSPVLNAIQAGCVGAQASNMMSVPTDCDQRDERLGWMGDADLSGDSITRNFDAGAFLNSFVDIMVDNQAPDGSLPDTVPNARYGGRPADGSWSAALPQVLWVRAFLDNDLSAAAAHWDALMLYLKNVAAQVARAGPLNLWKNPYGDWVPADPAAKVSNALPAAFNYVMNVRQAAALATSLGKSDDAKALNDLAATLTSAYAAAFYDPSTGCWGLCGQASAAFAWLLGVVPESQEQVFAANLSADISETYQNHVSVGIIGAKALFPTLTALGLGDQAVTLVEQTSKPSWGFMFFNDIEPATSNVWELWNADQEGPGMNSRNHHMFSSISAWLLAHVGGMGQASAAHFCNAADSPRTAPLDLRPAAVAGIRHAATTLTTSCGDVHLAYTRHGGVQCVRSPAAPAPAAPRTVMLACGAHGGVVSHVEFASWGAPAGTCGSHQNWTAAANCGLDLRRLVHQRCIGRASCELPTGGAAAWGSEAPLDGNVAGCDDVLGLGAPRVLAVQVTCSRPLAVAVAVGVPVGATARVTVPVASPTGTITVVHDAATTTTGDVWWSQAAAARQGDHGVTAAGRAQAVAHVQTLPAAAGIEVTLGSGAHAFVVLP